MTKRRIVNRLGHARHEQLQRLGIGEAAGQRLGQSFGVDTGIAADMATVFTWLAGRNNATYPTEYRASIEMLIEEWRPDVWAKSRASS